MEAAPETVGGFAIAAVGCRSRELLFAALATAAVGALESGTPLPLCTLAIGSSSTELGGLRKAAAIFGVDQPLTLVAGELSNVQTSCVCVKRGHGGNFRGGQILFITAHLWSLS